MKATTLQIITIFLTVFTLSVHAQQDSIPKPNSSFKPQIGSFQADYAYSPFTVKGTKMNIQQVNTAVMLPVYNHFENGKLDFFLAGVNYNQLFLSGLGNDFGGTKFYSVSVPLIFQKSLSAKYALMVSLIPTLSSDMKDVSGDDMLYTAAAMLKIRTSAKFSYSIGAVYSRQFFGSLLLPIIGIDWNITDKLSLSGSIPVSEKLKYQLSSKSAFGINTDFGIGGGSYRLSKKMNSDYFQVQQMKSSLFYEYSLAKNFTIQASAGYNFTQRLDLYSKDQKVNWAPFNNLNNRVPLEELKKPGVTFQSGINYRF
ncbi:hypothetical protein SAMN05216464_105275 [Mucilaginibacter pineti]|uniref:DUF6268 domain-containing protein n=1 Tax=Mucilaginibacter pineti TaxID=1391627 RepID=A0A1G7C3Z2_9SPHI|nr:DUF6268 family outer membrane beta-barrel protein [Mucilaginibacter pineti]SDE33973.1 hypothetical protein SAMN05216464_105275 [Mucilaginibacter pineti]